MKTLILVRHAKSDWGDPSLDDFDRPLNERGKKDAPVMAKRLKEKKISPDAIVSSPAKRAARTAKAFSEEFGIKKDKIEYYKELYLAPVSAFEEVVSRFNKKNKVVVLFSHNEGITSYANTLTDTRIDNIPTCGVFAVKADCNKWEDFAGAKKEFLFFDYPKAV